MYSRGPGTHLLSRTLSVSRLPHSLALSARHKKIQNECLAFFTAEHTRRARGFARLAALCTYQFCLPVSPSNFGIGWPVLGSNLGPLG